MLGGKIRQRAGMAACSAACAGFFALTGCEGTCPCDATAPVSPPAAAVSAPAPAPASAAPPPAALPSTISVPVALHSGTFEGWFVNGSAVKSYRAVHDREIKWVGEASARLQSIEPIEKGFGGLMQTFAADSYRGKRLRFSALVKTENVGGW